MVDYASCLGMEKAAAHVGIGRRQLHRLVKNGRLKSYGPGKRGGSYFRIQDLDRIKKRRASRPSGRRPQTSSPGLSRRESVQERKDTAAALLQAVLIVADSLYERRPDDLVGLYSASNWLVLLQSRLSAATFDGEMDVFGRFVKKWAAIRGVPVRAIRRSKLLQEELRPRLLIRAQNRGFDCRRIEEDFHGHFSERIGSARAEVINSMANDDVVQRIAIRDRRRAITLGRVCQKISSNCTARQIEVLALYVAAAACPLRLPRRIENETSVWDLERKVISAIIRAIVGDRRFNDLESLHGDIGAKFQRERPDLLFSRAIQAGVPKRHALLLADPFREWARTENLPPPQNPISGEKTIPGSRKGFLEYLAYRNRMAGALAATENLAPVLDVELMFATMMRLEEAKRDPNGNPSDHLREAPPRNQPAGDRKAVPRREEVKSDPPGKPPDHLKGALTEKQLKIVRRAGLTSYVNRYRWMTEESRKLGLPPSRFQISWAAGVTKSSVRELSGRLLQKEEIKAIITEYRLDDLLPVAEPGFRRPSATGRRLSPSNSQRNNGDYNDIDDPHTETRNDTQDPRAISQETLFENGDYAVDDCGPQTDNS